MGIEKDKEKISRMSTLGGQPEYVNWFEEGGGEVYRCNDMFMLFEIPAYGGEDRYEGVYHIDNIDDLLKKAYTWN